MTTSSKNAATRHTSTIAAAVFMYACVLPLFEIKKATTPKIKIGQGDEREYEYEMPASGDVKVVVIDAQTKEQIDFCSVERNDARGLDGLL